MRDRYPLIALITVGLVLVGCKRLAELSEVFGGTMSRGKAGVTWVRIPGGRFNMGSTEGERDEQPIHPVTLSSFQLTRSEITVGQYRVCVKAGACRVPDADECGSGNQLHCNFSRSARADHPVNCVSWKQARTFCRWVGGRLPSEAEWEYAARSRHSSWRYPWGNEPATCQRAVMQEGGTGCGRMETAEVCSKPAGKTAQGLCDMAGNVWEWVEDCWHDSYREAPVDGIPATRGCHPDYGRVLRGGSWGSFSMGLRAAVRSPYAPARRNNCGHNGFRCAGIK